MKVSHTPILSSYREYDHETFVKYTLTMHITKNFGILMFSEYRSLLSQGRPYLAIRPSIYISHIYPEGILTQYMMIIVKNLISISYLPYIF